jgi:nucleotide-binding universal stress UspA family protein
MFRTLVVPLDGSELSERALPYAVNLAAATHAEVILVRVALGAAPVTLDGADWERPQIEAVAEAEAYLSRIAQTLGAQVTVKTNVAYGRAEPELLEIIRQSAADAVVMATHGRTGLSHLLYGSVAEALLAESPVPVLLVQATTGQPPLVPFDPNTGRVVVPLDGSTFAETAIEAATHLVGPGGALVLVCVVEPPEDVERQETGRAIAYLDQQEEAATREAREYLSALSSQLKLRHPWIEVSQDVRLGNAVDGIRMAAADANAHIIVMATHGRTGITRARLGSVAGSVLRTGPLPVLLVGPVLQLTPGA